MKNLFKSLALLLVFTTLVFATASCVGQFALTNKLLKWNQGINKWVGSIILLVFILLPVYLVTLLIDWIILNVIEFYTGKNPVTSAADLPVKTATIEGRQVTLRFQPGDGVNFDLTTVEPDGTSKVLAIRSTERGVHGRLVENGKVTNYFTQAAPDGGIDRARNGKWEHIGADQAALALERFNDLGLRLAEAN